MTISRQNDIIKEKGGGKLAIKKLSVYLDEKIIEEMKIEKIKEKKSSVGQIVEEMWEKYKQEKNQKEK